MANIRTFVAVEISPEAQGRAGDLMERLRASGVKVSWTKLQNLHVTLKFLGDTPDNLIPDVCRAVSKACADKSSFTVRFGGAGAFPSVRRPQTLWLGVDQGVDEIVELQQAVDLALHQLRYPKERRRYIPHLTLGRVRGGTPEQVQELGNLLEHNARFEGGISIVEEVVVFASVLDRTAGPTYEVLSRVELP